MKTTASNLLRVSGLAAVIGGLVFAVRIHPPDTLAAVSTDEWVIVHAVGIAMCFLIMLGIGGLYARQAERAGWMGLAGFLALEAMWLLTAAFQFAEALILPLLATEAPRFVEGVVGITSGATSAVPLGALPAMFSVASVLYLMGGLLFGTATFRAGVLPRWGGAALAIGTVFPLMFALLPHDFIRLAAVPFGLALTWLGWALWSERPMPATTSQSVTSAAQLRPVNAD